jgi:hypothetical protein
MMMKKLAIAAGVMAVAASAQASMSDGQSASFAQLAGQAGRELMVRVHGDASNETTPAPGPAENTVAIAVPEPETYALLLAGLVAVGLVIRRRRR